MKWRFWEKLKKYNKNESNWQEDDVKNDCYTQVEFEDYSHCC